MVLVINSFPRFCSETKKFRVTLCFGSIDISVQATEVNNKNTSQVPLIQYMFKLVLYLDSTVIND